MYWLRLLRPHQWIKNLFVLTGLLFSHAWHNSQLVTEVFGTLIAFSLTSSCIYIINDILDRGHDQQHPKKSARPIASGKISVHNALAVALILGTGGLVLGAKIGVSALGILLTYIIINLAYSFQLKNVVILDVFLISAGFMLRLLAGTTGVGIHPSQWLLLCGLMVTLFLGFTKRRAEIIALKQSKGSHRKVLEHYSPTILDQMIGISAAGAIMSYSLYTMSEDTARMHGTTDLIYTVPFVAYGIFRYIYLLHHQNYGGDPAYDFMHDAHLAACIIGWLGATLWLIA